MCTSNIAGKLKHQERRAPLRSFFMPNVNRKPLTMSEFRGLANLGNTCYMNAVMQALGGVEPFRQQLRPCAAACRGGLVECADQLWQKMDRGDLVRPDQLKQQVAKVLPQFAGSAQHDAHEFTVTFLTSLDEDAKRRPTGTAAPTSVFDFTCDVEMVCSVCAETKTMTEEHKELCLSIPEETKEFWCEKLVDEVFAEGRLDCRCESELCADKGNRAFTARRRLAEHAHPRALQLTLKRFEPNFKLNRIDKRTEVINFSHDLELQGRWYELTSVVTHVGQRAGSGHYISYVRRAGKWREFDDSRVREVDDLPVALRSNAYLLFYTLTDAQSAP